MAASDQPREYRLERPDQLRALASPVRQALVDQLRLQGPSTVAELAPFVGRPAESLYYHVRQLVAAGLLVEVEKRPTGKRPETVYDLVAPVLRVDSKNRSASWREEIERLMRLRLRAVEREFGAALRRGSVPREGLDRGLFARAQRIRLTRRARRELNRRLDELMDFLEQEGAGKKGELYSFLGVLAPLEEPS